MTRTLLNDCCALSRLTRDSPSFKDELDVMKFVCKDFWTKVFRRQVDNLRTNHQVQSKCRGCGLARVQRKMGQHALGRVCSVWGVLGELQLYPKSLRFLLTDWSVYIL